MPAQIGSMGQQTSGNQIGGPIPAHDNQKSPWGIFEPLYDAGFPALYRLRQGYSLQDLRMGSNDPRQQPGGLNIQSHSTMGSPSLNFADESNFTWSIGVDPLDNKNLYFFSYVGGSGLISLVLDYTSGEARFVNKFGYGNAALSNISGVAGGGPQLGVGGVVAQLSSKSTAVVLNKPVGQITTHNASLAATTTAVFRVTNSAVTASDVVVLNQQSGGTSGSYVTGVERVAAGSFDVFIRNVTAAPLAEALVLNFAVIKGTLI